jgi:hypothetical protein
MSPTGIPCTVSSDGSVDCVDFVGSVGGVELSSVVGGAELTSVVLGGTGRTGLLDESSVVTGVLTSLLADVVGVVDVGGDDIEPDVVASADAAAGSMPGLPATVLAQPAITVTAARAQANRHARAFMWFHLEFDWSAGADRCPRDRPGLRGRTVSGRAPVRGRFGDSCAGQVPMERHGR